MMTTAPWMANEARLHSQVIRTMANQNQSVVLITPSDTLARELVCDVASSLQLPDRHPRTTFELAAASLDLETPEGWVEQALRVNVPIRFRHDLPERDKPYFVFIHGLKPSSHIVNELNKWVEFLRRFRDDTYAGRGIRILLHFEASVPGLGEFVSPGRSLDGFSTIVYPDPTEDQLHSYCMDEISRRISVSLPWAQKYLCLRLLDLSGGGRFGLDFVLGKAALLSASTRSDGWLDHIDWDNKDEPVRRTKDRWSSLLHEYPDGVRSLLKKGGFLIPSTYRQFTKEHESLLTRLWLEGMWVETGTWHVAGSLTPCAIHALKWALDEHPLGLGVQGWSVPPSFSDRVSRELLERCLLLERLLKLRFRQYITGKNAHSALHNLLSSQSPRRGTDWRTYLEINTKSTGLMDLDLVEAASLAPFLKVFREVLGIPGDPARDDVFVRVRNSTAHLRRSTWSLYKDLAEIESYIAQLGE